MCNNLLESSFIPHDSANLFVKLIVIISLHVRWTFVTIQSDDHYRLSSSLNCVSVHWSRDILSVHIFEKLTNCTSVSLIHSASIILRSSRSRNEQLIASASQSTWQRDQRKHLPVRFTYISTDLDLWINYLWCEKKCDVARRRVCASYRRYFFFFFIAVAHDFSETPIISIKLLRERKNNRTVFAFRFAARQRTENLSRAHGDDDGKSDVLARCVQVGFIFTPCDIDDTL